MAKANRQTARTFVSLKAVSDALQNRAGQSEQRVKEFIILGMYCGGLRYRHCAPGEPPPNLLGIAPPEDYTFDGSDIISPVLIIADMGPEPREYRIPGVSIAWEDVVAKFPELGAEPPKLGTSRVEVSFATPLMRWFEKLMARLWRKSPSLKPATRIDTEELPTADALDPAKAACAAYLEKMRRAGHLRGAQREMIAACILDAGGVTPALGAKGLVEMVERWRCREAEAAGRKPPAPLNYDALWRACDRFLKVYRQPL